MFWFTISAIFCGLILWLTSLSGLKFYNIRTNKDDVRSVRLIIHLCFICLTTYFVVLLMKGDYVSVYKENENKKEIQEMVINPTSETRD